MKKNEIYGYEPLVDDLKELIHKKQYKVIKLIKEKRYIDNSRKKGGENQLYRCFQ